MEKFPAGLLKILHALPLIGPSPDVVTVLELSGAIGAAAGRNGLSLKKLEKAIERAFKPAGLKAVALAVNSPGGSPVQSRLIFNAIRRKAEESETPVLTFIEDVGASGGYILALAGDEIFADDSSVVGSIGVVSGGFGFHEAISRFGIERRLYTAGENKAMLDPFRAENPDDVARLKSLLDQLHGQFIALVRSRRGDKLSASHDDVFSGAFWAAPAAIERGLVDNLGRLGEILRDRFGKDVRIRRISPDVGNPLLRLIFGGSPNSGAGLVDPEAVLAAAEARALWARFGL